MPGIPRWRAILALAALALPASSLPASLLRGPLAAQPAALPQVVTPAADEVAVFNPQQLDALLAPVALYPDTLLTQMLMAAAYPQDIVGAARWLEQPANKALAGDALERALASQAWNPAVKSLVPFPQVLAMLDTRLDWTRQVGYAFSTQQADVLGAVQRLRRQALDAGTLVSGDRQVVRIVGQTIIIAPADPQVVYVPSYNPVNAFGPWPYSAYPPVVLPPPGHALGTALLGGLAFGAGVAVVAGLWDVGSPAWGSGHVNVNVARYNAINVNRAPLGVSRWQAPPRAPGAVVRPPAGPVGQPARAAGLPANAIGRPSVAVPGNAVDRSTAPPLPRVSRPTPQPAPPPAFADRADGRAAAQFEARGSQSRQQATPAPQQPAGRRGGGRGR